MGCVSQKQPNPRSTQSPNQSLKVKKACPQNEIVKLQQKEQLAQAGSSIVGQNVVSIQKHEGQVSANARTGDSRRQQLLNKYQIDNEQKVPNLPKMHSYNYQALLVHNPDHNIPENNT